MIIGPRVKPEAVPAEGVFFVLFKRPRSRAGLCLESIGRDWHSLANCRDQEYKILGPESEDQFKLKWKPVSQQDIHSPCGASSCILQDPGSRLGSLPVFSWLRHSVLPGQRRAPT